MHFPTLLSTFALLSTAHGCVKMTATISSGLSNTASLVIVDDGVKVCDGRINGCAGVISCSTSPRWNWAYIDMCKNSFDKGPREASEEEGARSIQTRRMREHLKRGEVGIMKSFRRYLGFGDIN
ncbi:hypothetical protein TWF481_010450 [Arthrobotrys musiformis]|uniref:Uncharacterized protein n=1 Tax=Arthrobotrys musiformis TaxID=47236 RepID=A0AAV9W363_9PEZI